VARPAPARTRDSMGTKFEIQNQTPRSALTLRPNQCSNQGTYWPISKLGEKPNKLPVSGFRKLSLQFDEDQGLVILI
jgi:hypothetical protein